VAEKFLAFTFKVELVVFIPYTSASYEGNIMQPTSEHLTMGMISAFFCDLYSLPTQITKIDAAPC